MLKNTFIHLPGIGTVTEQRIWEKGISDWDSFIRQTDVCLSLKRDALLRSGLEESRAHVKGENPSYFADRLPANHQWRLFREFRDSTVYLDIETTGMNGSSNEITVIGLYDGTSVTYYVKDRNLDDFREDIEKYKVIVTYNGKCFDVPFIRNAMGLPMDHAHIDLRYVLSSFGFRGGLKGCERAAGIDRGTLSGLDGYDAVLLWYDYEYNGNEKALETLLAYNGQDIVNLETLLILAYNENLRLTPFVTTNRIPEPLIPTLPFVADRETIEKIRFQKRAFGM